MTIKIPKISVIIPVYNAQEYLKRCLDSVCKQTLQEIEIICINDCSSDNSAQIIEKYAKSYANLTILHLKENKGESAARNYGLSLAKGEYLAFVDNDDEVDLNFYEKLYEKARKTDADIVKGQAIEIAYDGKKNYIKQIQEEDKGNKLLFSTCWWTAIYKRSVISKNNISFSVQHPLGGDLLFLNRAVIAAKDLQFVNGVYYHYHRREDSGDSKVLSEKKIKSALNIFEAIIDNINANVLVSDFVYNFIFHQFILACFDISLKNDEREVKQICAMVAINIFEKCADKPDLKIRFSETAPYLFMMLNNKDKAGVENLFVKCSSRLELVISGLRARIRNKV